MMFQILFAVPLLIAVMLLNMELLFAEYNHKNSKISSLSSVLNLSLLTYIQLGLVFCVHHSIYQH